MNPEIERLLSEIEKSILAFEPGKSPERLYAPINYMMSIGGKRIRPLLVLLAYRIFSEHHQKAMDAALAVEVFHNFTLLHDDIMDKAPLRRGKKTVHEQWDSNVAILSGDVMLVKAYEVLLRTNHPKLADVLQLFNTCAAQVCEGQQFDMDFETENAVSEDQYIDMIRLKTAVLLGFSLQIGAILANADDNVASQLREFGELIGIGFQLKDDLLDVYGDQKKFGKQVGGDIASNKKTFLLIEALLNARGKDREELDFWLNQPTFDVSKKVEAITSIYNRLGIKEITGKKIDYYFDRAFDLIRSLQPESHGKRILIDFTEWLVARDK